MLRLKASNSSDSILIVSSTVVDTRARRASPDCFHVLGACPGEPLHEYSNPSVGQLEHPHDQRYRADSVQVRCRRFLHLAILLSYQQHHAVACQGFIHGLNRLGTRDKEGHDHVGERDDIRQRKNGENFGDRKLLIVSGFFQNLVGDYSHLRIVGHVVLIHLWG